MEMFRTELPSTTTAPQLVRAWLRTTLQTWSLDGFGDVTELLTSELVANVVSHVGGPMSVRISHSPDAIRVEVDDASPAPPTVERFGTSDEHGRGVFIVDRLANRWGVVGHPDDGKTVWFELDVATATREAHGGDVQ